ncbi:MAG: alpha/beta fold hydrolase [Nitratireductor sp.]
MANQATLFKIDENPIPSDAVVGFCTTEDEQQIRYAHWKTQRPKSHGTVLLLSGRSEFIEKNYETISDLRRNGYDVFTFDWRGQGGSSRILNDAKVGFVETFDDYLKDLDTVFSSIVLPDCKAPFFIMGHSTGSLVALMAAPMLKNQIQKMVLGSPLLGLSNLPLPAPAIKLIAGALHVIGLGRLFVSGGRNPHTRRTFENNKVTNDKRRFNLIQKFEREHDHLLIGGPSATWVFSALRAMSKVVDSNFASTLTIPTLLICAGEDRLVDNHTTEYFGHRLRSGKTLTIDGAKHELLQEKDYYRNQFLAAFYAFTASSNPAAFKQAEQDDDASASSNNENESEKGNELVAEKS